ncbi:MAG TPA: hypothetical protein VLA77_01790 [Candidatus Saccharimonadales bacterium]|nr:hypothetical protein [Candidatus Saccharimonadales bacterium]
MAAHAHVPKNGKHTFLNKIVNVMAVVGPLFGLPQVISIHTTHQVEGLALWSWIGFCAYSIVFLTYGIVYKLRPVILAQVMWLTVYTLIIVGILLYN